MNILITDKQSRFTIDPDDLRRKAQKILDMMNSAGRELSVLIVDDIEMTELNRNYLGRDRPTNVIAFPMQEGAFSQINPGLLGDVVISSDTAYRESREGGIDFETRFLELLVHGILHLLGYDHEQSEADAAVMEEKSEMIMSAKIGRAHV